MARSHEAQSLLQEITAAEKNLEYQRARMEVGMEFRDKFKEVYGEELLAYSDAWVNRSNDYPSTTRLGDNTVLVDNVNIRKPLSDLIVRSLEGQPSESRGEWMAQYLGAIELLREV